MLWVPLKDVAQNCVSLSVLQELVAVPRQALVTNSILLCGLFTIEDQCKEVRFQQTNNQGLRR